MIEDHLIDPYNAISLINTAQCFFLRLCREKEMETKTTFKTGLILFSNVKYIHTDIRFVKYSVAMI